MAKPQASAFRETAAYMIRHVSRHWKIVAVLFVAITIGRGLGTYVLTFYRTFIDTLTGAGGLQPDAEVLVSIILQIVLVNLVIWLAWRTVEYIDATLMPRIMGEMVQDAYSYLVRHSYQFFIDSFAGSLVKKINRLPDGYLSVSDSIIYALYPNLIQISISLYLVYTVEPFLSLLLGGWIIVFVGANYYFALQKLHFENIVNAAESKLSGFLADTVVNNFNLTIFSTYKKEEKLLDKRVQKWNSAQTRSWLVSTITSAVQALLMIFIEAVLLILGIQFWQNGQMTAGDFVLLQTLLFSLFGRLWDFGKNIRDLGKGFSKAQEMIEIFMVPHQIVDTSNATPLRVSEGKIEFKNLTFAYDNGKNVFRNFSLEIPAKKKIALVSRSGSGKTTLTRLLLRLYDVPEYTTFIDNQDIMHVTLESLRSHIAYVPQEPMLFHRTLAENIAYGNQNASMEQIIAASKKAHCHEFISKLPEGYKTYVGERGVKLSGGERQRVAIARAILKNSPIIILDEATSSLDSESEKLIQDALQELMKDKTAIVIAHRLSTISAMDEIIVIEHGRITERGTHKQLLKHDRGHYKNLWDIQAGGFEE